MAPHGHPAGRLTASDVVGVWFYVELGWLSEELTHLAIDPAPRSDSLRATSRLASHLFARWVWPFLPSHPPSQQLGSGLPSGQGTGDPVGPISHRLLFPGRIEVRSPLGAIGGSIPARGHKEESRRVVLNLSVTVRDSWSGGLWGWSGGNFWSQIENIGR